MKIKKIITGKIPVPKLFLLFLAITIGSLFKIYSQMSLPTTIDQDIISSTAIISDYNVTTTVETGRSVIIASAESITFQKGFSANCKNGTELTVFKANSIATCSGCDEAAGLIETNDPNGIINTSNGVSTISGTPGDIIVLGDGTANYTNCKIVLSANANGQIGKPIMLKANTQGGVTFTGSASKITISGDYKRVSGIIFSNIENQPVVQFKGAQYSQLSDCEFNGCGQTVGTSYSDFPIVEMRGDELNSYKGTQNSTVCNNDFTGLKAKAIDIRFYHDINNNPIDVNNTNNSIKYNYFNNITPDPGWENTNGCEIVQLGQQRGGDLDVGNNVVEYNLFNNTTTDAEIISVKTSGNVVRFNTIDNSDATNNASQLVLRLGENNVVESNYLFNCGGIRIVGEGHKVFNNYIFNPFYNQLGTSGAIELETGAYTYSNDDALGHYYYQVKDCWIVNNTIINFSQVGGVILGINYGQYDNRPVNTGVLCNKQPINNTINNNLVQSYYGHMFDKCLNCVLEENNWNKNYAKNTGTNGDGIISPDKVILVGSLAPLFDTPIDNIYYISNNSFAINNGYYSNATGYFNAVDDFEGQLRGTSPDVGCDEYSTEATTRSRLYPNQVGASYNSLSRSARVEFEPEKELIQIQNDPIVSTTGFWFYDKCLNLKIATEGNYVVDIYNTLGQKVQSYKLDNMLVGAGKIENVNLGNGIYVVNLLKGNEIMKTQKIAAF